MTELLAEKIQSKGVDARIDEAEAKTKDLEDVPEPVVEARVVMVPYYVDVAGQPAQDEDNDEGEYHLRNLLPSIHLSLMLVGPTVHLPWNETIHMESDRGGYTWVYMVHICMYVCRPIHVCMYVCM